MCVDWEVCYSVSVVLVHMHTEVTTKSQDGLCCAVVFGSTCYFLLWSKHYKSQRRSKCWVASSVCRSVFLSVVVRVMVWVLAAKFSMNGPGRLIYPLTPEADQDCSRLVAVGRVREALTDAAHAITSLWLYRALQSPGLLIRHLSPVFKFS